MTIGNNINDNVYDFFSNNKNLLNDYAETNKILKEICGVNNFFENQKQSDEFLNYIKNNCFDYIEENRREYGDFQTNSDLSDNVISYIYEKDNQIDFILEPTCGKGNFILSSLKKFDSLKKVIGVEIYLPYVWDLKFKILSFYLKNDNKNKPDIDIIHSDVFEYDFEKLANQTSNLKTLIVGNPPWVTNSELGSISSKNLPKKSNFKGLKGFEALTGKGNFDLGESISLLIIKNFQNHNGYFSFLIKNSVIKNLISSQKNNLFKLYDIEMLNIDSKKEFDVSVNASLFFSKFKLKTEFICKEYDFYTLKQITVFGWYKNKFVSSIDDYDKSSFIDHKSPFTWRSGVKHDCTKIMELTKNDQFYSNKDGHNNIELDSELVYPFLKSSDLKSNLINQSRKYTIVTQKSIGQCTKYIEHKYPKTFNYLNNNIDHFKKRKSSIYINKPMFSIFGIGDYSFKKYKVAISGLYKTTHFSLVYSIDDNVMMLDDTCYFLGFEKLSDAKITHYLLNHNIVQRFLKSIVFKDAKRPINKDILMRIDIEKLYNEISIDNIDFKFLEITKSDWEEYSNLFVNTSIKQNLLFEL